jgi:glucose/mannose-6-phosphate isomerase
MTTMLELVLELPAQLRWAAGMETPASPAADAAIVAGMGGSGISGDAAAVVAAEAGRRVAVHKSYGLPAWAREELIVAVSHSGNTEETNSAIDEALARSLALMGVTTGGRVAERSGTDGFDLVTVPPGPQPRAAFGYLAGAVLRVLEGAGVVPPQSAALAEAADVVEAVLEGDGPAMAEEIADALLGRFAVIYGGVGAAEVAANRWKTQINENSKAPAAWIPMPEGNHNDIVGWTAHPDLSADAVATVFLHDSGDHPRTTLRGRFTEELMAPMVPTAAVIESRGTSPVARLFSLVAIGDLVSVALTERSGVDPMPVDVIQDLKARLAQE